MRLCDLLVLLFFLFSAFTILGALARSPEKPSDTQRLELESIPTGTSWVDRGGADNG